MGYRKVRNPYKLIRCYLALLMGLSVLCCVVYVHLHESKFSTTTLPSGPSLLQSSRCLCSLEEENLHDLRNINFYSEDNISEAYHNDYVGFLGMEGVNCPMALSTPTNNSMYQQTVKRKWAPEILNDAQNCSYFVNKYGFNRYPKPSAEEKDFPIAFIVLFHQDLDQVLFLLRAIYRSHNAYCLTLDTKAKARLLLATRAVARCLPNVFVSSKLEDVVYAGMSRLMADINCFRDLIKHPVKWRYIINSPGQQFPLKTNLEIVQILKLFGGSNDIMGETGNSVENYRHEYVFEEREYIVMTDKRHVPPPFGLRIVKCSAYASFSRPFVQFVLTSKLAKDLLEWCKDIYSPDERYWGMLNYNRIEPAPGGYLGEPNDNPWLTSFNIWQKDKHLTCRSVFVRWTCIFGPADLPLLVTLPHLFANKLNINYHPAALHCLDQRIFNNTVSGTTINTQTYQSILKNRTEPKSLGAFVEGEHRISD